MLRPLQGEVSSCQLIAISVFRHDYCAPLQNPLVLIETDLKALTALLASDIYCALRNQVTGLRSSSPKMCTFSKCTQQGHLPYIAE